MSTPLIFNHRRVAAKRARALRRTGGASFLRDRIADDLIDRLHDTTRSFGALCDVASLGVIAERVQRGEVEKIAAADLREFRRGDDNAEWLDVQPGHYDAITSVLGLGFVNDLPGALVQCRLALKPDGFFLATLYGPLTLMEVREALSTAEMALTGGEALRVLPFVDAPTAVSLLARAGFALPVVDQHTITVNYREISTLITDLRDLGHGASLNDAPPALRRDVWAFAVAELEKRRGADGTIPITFEAVTLTGWSPSPDQPKAARPGSATVRLADALGVEEKSAGEKAGRP